MFLGIRWCVFSLLFSPLSLSFPHMRGSLARYFTHVLTARVLQHAKKQFYVSVYSHAADSIPQGHDDTWEEVVPPSFVARDQLDGLCVFIFRSLVCDLS